VRPADEADLKRLEAELAKNAEAIANAATRKLPSLIDAIKTRERRREDLHQRLLQLDAAGVSAKIPSAADIRGRVQRRLDGWWRLFERHPVDARQQVLKPLFGGAPLGADADVRQRARRGRVPRAVRDAARAKSP
jgi:hypothetical protein